MNTSIAVNLISVSFFAAIVFTGFLRTLAKRYNFLIDLPDKNRKFHKRPTPLVGGLGIHLSMLFGLAILFLSVDTIIYDQTNSVTTINSKLQITNESQLEEYNVSASKIDSNKDDLSQYEVIIERGEPPIIITQNLEGNFELITPSGDLKVFSYIDGKLIDLNEKEIFEVKAPGENDYFTLTIPMLGIVIMGIFLQLLMLIDDVSGLTQMKRLIIQSAASLGVILISGEYISNIGFNFFGWNGDLGYFGIIFTIFAVTGIINAFNMFDGINGLCSGAALIVFVALVYIGGSSTLSYGSLVTMSGLLGFLVYNLGLFGAKRSVFLGDNGSNFLGFLVAWSCIYYSSETMGLINPVTALWLVSIPLWDCIHLIYQRSVSGKGPFEGDRRHFHHILFDKTSLTGNWPLFAILISCLFLASFGIFIETFLNPIYSFAAFIIFGLVFISIKQKLEAKAY